MHHSLSAPVVRTSLLILLCFPNLANSASEDGYGLVSSASPEATQAGVDILQAGGNAIDAAVAISFALGVTEPAGSGIGGQTIMLVHPPNQAPFVINGTSFAPANIPVNVSADDLTGHRATTVPSTVKVLDFAWRKFGSGAINWPALLAPAIHYAESGYQLGHFRQRSLARYAHRLRRDQTISKLHLGNDGTIPKVSSLMRIPVLANTLRLLAERGGKDFYQGDIAKLIAADMQQHQGWITLDDLRNFPEPEIVQALQGSYRGWDVYSLPPPTGGWVVLQALNLLEQFEQSELADLQLQRWIALAETLRVVHGERLQTPISDLIHHHGQTQKKTSKETAKTMSRLLQSRGGETTHFSVVDKDGMAVAVTASLNAYFGARVASPELGFLYNDYMHEFELDQQDHPFQLRGGAMPYSSMSATILARDGKPYLAVGSPGSKRIISAVVQVISDWVDVGQGIEQAVARSRIHVIPDEELFIEARQRTIPARLLLELELMGYSIVRPLSSLYKENLNPYFGGVHAIALDKGKWRGAADPRRDGTVGRTR